MQALDGLAGDFWYEELAANRLSAAWARRFRSDLVVSARQIAAETLAGRPEGLSAEARAIVDRLLAPDCRPEDVKPGYGTISMEHIAVIQFALIQRLLDEDHSLHALVADLLGPVAAAGASGRHEESQRRR